MSKLAFRMVALLIVAMSLVGVASRAYSVPLSLPAPVEWATAPVGAPAAPGDTFGVTFTDPSGTADPNAPVIGEWNRTAKPGETFALTGTRFTTRTGTDAGTDTTVWIWADSPSGGILTQARVWRVTSYNLTALMPTDLPMGVYLVWVENANGPSKPVCINRVVSQWIGPLGNLAAAGDTKRVFGKNMSYAHGSGTSYAYMQPAAGGTLTQLTVSKVEPYDVQFTVPVGTPNGSYNIYVHNGQGGQYGWGDPVTLTVRTPWARGADEIDLNPTGGDDTFALQTAINTLSAKPSGGTVRLASGVFNVGGLVWIKDKVMLVGAGMDNTTVQWQSISQSALLNFSGNNITVQDLTLKRCFTGNDPIYGFWGEGSPTGGLYSLADINITRVRVSCETGVKIMRCTLNGTRLEWSNCEVSAGVNAGLFDGWVHDCKLYGGPLSESEAAITSAERNVIEHNLIETPDWPHNGNNYNYLDAGGNPDLSILPGGWNQLYSTIMAKRVWLCQGGDQQWCNNNYIAWNTTKDVAVQDNKGEMILFHGGQGAWFGQCLSTTGNTTTVRTDGKVDTPSGPQSYTVSQYQVRAITCGESVPDSYSFGFLIDGGMDAGNPLYPGGNSAIYMTIISGAGMGQSRQILSHTPNTITVRTPWRVQPDSTSMAVLSSQYRDNIVYMNDLNAFPPGYIQSYSASCGVDIDGNGWGIEIEGNTSRRTYGTRGMLANAMGVTYWCTTRNDSSYEADHYGLGLTTAEVNPIGYCNWASMFHGGTVQITGSSGSSLANGGEDGDVYEGMTLSGSSPGFVANNSEVIFRNNTVTTPAGQGVTLTANANPILLGNTYPGAAQTYYIPTGGTFAEKPLPEYRVARFKGYVGASVGSVAIPVANAGIQGMVCTANPSDSWITASLPAGTVGAEQEIGRLVVSVDTTGMPAGKHWGYVDILTGARSARVGVCVDLSAGSGNHPPTPAFTTNPASGTLPLSVDFNAAASVDTDGRITNYAWDFGDGSYSSGTRASHTYSAAGTYAPVLTVTDDDGATNVTYSTILVAPALAGVTLTGSPNPPLDPGTPVTLTASATGGYQVQFKFMVNSGSGWQTIRAYQSGNTCVWTPSQSGYYSLKVYARNSVSTAAYDATSSELGYAVGMIPASGLKLWLRGDIGVSCDGTAKISGWTDQSAGANNFTQSTPAYRPTYVSDSGNARQAVRFGTGSPIMTNPNRVIVGNTEFTCITLLKYNGSGLPTSNEYIFWNGLDPSNNYGGYGMWVDIFGHLTASWSLNGGKLYDAGVIAGGQWYILTSRYGGGTHQLWLNGTSKGSVAKGNSNITAGSTSVGNKVTASYQGFDGDIQEVLVYNRALSDAERTAVESYLSTRYQPQAKTTIAAVRALPDGSTVSLTSAKVVTVASGTFTDARYYIEEPDRSSGIDVIGPGSVSIGDSVTINGTVGTDVNGEKTLYVSTINSQSSGDPLSPLGMLGKSLVQGMLVRVWGRVTTKTDSYLILDDGSGSAIRAQLDSLVIPMVTTPSVGDYVSVTGPAGLTSGGIAVVRPRSGADVQVY